MLGEQRHQGAPVLLRQVAAQGVVEIGDQAGADPVVLQGEAQRAQAHAVAWVGGDLQGAQANHLQA